jgi:hypothetical protein
MLLGRQVQRAVSRIQVLAAAGAVSDPTHPNAPEHRLKRPLVTSLDV